jgi:mono/diheme cytochrome c family protein
MGLIRLIAACILLALISRAAWPDEPPAAEAGRTIWDGVYTEAQAKRGEAIYPSVCGRCHGYKLDGAPDDPDMLPTPPIAGPKFLRRWNGGSLATLFEVTRTTMPAINPQSLSDQEFADLIAYALSVSRARPGPMELEPETTALADIVIEQRQ